MYLGIDLGTSGVKLVLINEVQTVVGLAQAELTVSQPQALWSEQDPAAWWQALLSAMVQLRTQVPQQLAQVTAIGLSGQMHGAVLLDAANKVIRPAILWNDGRSAAQCQQIEARVPASREITGNLAMPGFTAPKLLWVSQQEPANFARTRSVLLPKDWLRLQLSGEAVSDMSDASGTLWLDVKHRRWSDEMLTVCGMDASYMPRLCEGSQVSAHLKDELAREWGMRPGVVIAGGAGDNAASAIGVGAVQPGEGFVSLGTSGVIFMVGQGYASAPERALHAFAHALPNRWHTMSVMLSAAASLTWATRLMGLAGEQALLDLAATCTPNDCARAPLFLPYLSGERTPHNNPQASSAFIGLRSEHTRQHLAYAVAEGVCFGLMDGWHLMRANRSNNSALHVVGGAARSDFLVQLLASGLNCNLKRTKEAGHAAAIGAARLAALSVGDSEERICIGASADAQWEPLAFQTQCLAERHGQFEAQYSRSAIW